MNKIKLAVFWDAIPIGKSNAISYEELTIAWGINARSVRQILHELSLFDNGDDYILIRSASDKGFYRTDNHETIKAYRQECLNKGRSVFAPVKKINRVLNANTEQFQIENNLRVIRESRGLKQADVCRLIRQYDKAVDKAMLSKFENSVCLPTPFQLSKLAEIYGCEPSEIVNMDIDPIKSKTRKRATASRLKA